MRSKLIFALFILCLSVSTTHAQTQVFGISKENIGIVLKAYTFSDPICNDKIILETDTINTNGEFRLTIQSEETIPVYIDYGRITLFLYVEKNDSYEIVLPKYEERTAYEEHSSFFKPKLHYVGIKSTNKENINSRVRDFDNKFYQLISENRKGITSKESDKTIASIQKTLDREFPLQEETFEYFRIHTQFRFVELSMLNSSVSLDSIAINSFGSNQYFQYNKAYNKVFNQLFTNYLLFLSRQVNNKGLKKMLYTGDRVGLETYLYQKGFNKEITPYIILKTYKDASGTHSFPEKVNVKLITSYLKHPNKHVQQQAQRIIGRSFKMLVGSKTPDFNLSDNFGNTKSLSDFEGKYLYLCFMKSASGDFMKEQAIQEQIARQFKEFLRVAIVFTDKLPEYSNPEKAVTYLDGSSNKSLLDQYQITTLPTYYLIGEKGIIMQSPAVAPSEGFSSSFLRYYREKAMEEHRKKVRSKQ